MELETLLRPIPEYRSAVLSSAMSFYLFFYASESLVLPVIAVPASIFFAAVGAYRLWEATKVKFYQQHLMASPKYVVPLSKIPKLKNRDFYGMGFLWVSKHMARLDESNRIDNEKYIKLNWKVRLGNWLSIFFQKRRWETLDKLVTKDSVFNPLRPLPDLGGTPQLHGVGLYESEKEVLENTGERFGHRRVDGTTRSGKTVAARVMIWQDVHRDMPTIVFDPKGDEDLLEATYAAAKAAGKEDKFVFFHLGFPEHSARYTPFANIARMTEVATITTSSLPSTGNASSFKEFAWRFVNNIQMAMAPIGERATYKKILEYANNIDILFVKYCEHLQKKQADEYPEVAAMFRSESDNKQANDKGGRPNQIEKQWSDKAVAWVRATKAIDAQIPGWIDETLRSLMSIMEHEKSHFQKLVNSLYPLLEKLTTGAVGELLSPDYEDFTDTRQILDWRSVIKENKVVYCGFDALADTTVAGAVSVAMLSDLVSTAGEIYKHGTAPGVPEEYREGIKPISLYADEGSDLIGADFIPLINKGGGAGIQTTMLTQSSISDVEVKLGSKAAAVQALSNFNTQMIFRVRTKETAMSFCEQLGMASYNQSMVFTGATDSPDPSSNVEFVSSTQHRIAIKEVQLLTPDHLINLPKGHSFLMTNGRLYKIRWPYTVVDKKLLPDSILEVSERMATNYQTSNNWFVDKWYMTQVLDIAEDEVEEFAETYNEDKMAGRKDDQFFGQTGGIAQDMLNEVSFDDGGAF